MDNKSERITKSIRLSPKIDKDMSLFCRLENKSQADYINEVIAKDLSFRTLKRSEFENKIMFSIPLDPADIEKFIAEKIDLARFNPYDADFDAETIVINLNNYLDAWTPQGTYCSPFGFDKHSGLTILTYDANTYYIYFQFKENPNNLLRKQIADNESDFVNVNKNYEDLSEKVLLNNIKFDRDILLNFVYLIDKSSALYYSELAKNQSLIDILKKDKPIENKIVSNNPVTKADIKQYGLARELEYTKNHLREIEKEKDAKISELEAEIEALKNQNKLLINDKEMLDKRIENAIKNALKEYY